MDGDPHNWSAGRVPPHDLDAEAAVLSAVLVDGMRLDEIASTLDAKHFYSEAHRRIYEACIDLRRSATTVDVITVAGWLKSRERIAQVGGMGYLTEVMNAAPAIVQIGAYAAIVIDKAKARSVIQTAQHVAASGYVDYGTANAYADDAAQRFQEISFSADQSGPEHIKCPLVAAATEVQAAAMSGRGMLGVPTGFTRYDYLTGGLHDSDFTVVAARPGMGKTSLACQAAMKIAAPYAFMVPGGEAPADPPDSGGHGVAIFSMEMPKDQLALRMACSWGGVNFQRIRLGRMRPGDWTALIAASSAICRLPLWIDDTPALTSLEMRARLRRVQAEALKRGTPLKVFVADYLQLMTGQGRSVEEQVSETAQSMKETCKLLKLAGFALAQMNRKVEERGPKNKRPMLSDLRSSGNIEQAADNIAFLWEGDQKPTDRDFLPVTLSLEKQRNGPKGDSDLLFEKRHTRFHAPRNDQYEQPEDDL